MELDASHPTIQALAELLPDAKIGGGSFAHWLQHPIQVAAERRAGVFKTAQKSALEQCLRGLLGQLGLPANTKVRTGRDGQRLWPSGYVGSITHKGTVVLGALAPAATLRSFGIDLERIGAHGDPRIGTFIAFEGLPPGAHSDSGTLIAFSAKEAVFKAFYSLQRKRLKLSDIRLIWSRRDFDRQEASAECPGSVSFIVRWKRVDRWIVTAAIPGSLDS